MGLSKIEWTDYTFNPWWGCVKVSPACDHCYAEALAKRYGHQVWGAKTPRRFFGDAHWQEPRNWNVRAESHGKRFRVFCGSMCDVMEDPARIPGEYIKGEYESLDGARKRLYDLIRATPNLDWLLLTKRPQNFRRFLPVAWLKNPQANVWLMTTVESNDFLWRAAELLKVRAVVHGVSYEPALGPVDFNDLLYPLDVTDHEEGTLLHRDALSWIIAGGESGTGARPSNPDWYRSVRDQCAAAGVAFLFKQWGEWGVVREPIGETLVSIITTGDTGADVSAMKRVGKKAAGRLLDGVGHNDLPVVRLG